MSRRRPLPGEARRLINDSVHSVGVLDLLVLLRVEPERWWTPQEVAERLPCPVGWAAQELESLHAGGLLDVDGDEERRYLFRPRSARLADAVDALAEAYAANMPDVVRLILSTAPRLGGRRSRPGR
jgi:DNA-binding IclR family transcriptional regulator